MIERHHTPGDSPAPEGTRSLVRLAQAGQREAAEELFHRYIPRLRSVVRLRLGPLARTRLESDDVVQRTLEVALQKLPKFEFESSASFLNWLATIATRSIRDAAKSAHVRRNRPSATPGRGDDSVSDLSSSGVQAVDVLADRELLDLMERCLAELTEPQRELIVLRDLLEGDWDFVARTVGKPSPDAARMSHARAMAALEDRFRRAEGA